MDNLRILLKLFCIFLYIVLIYLNYRCFKYNRTATLLTLITIFVSTLFLFSSNTADFSWEEVKLDMSGYRTIYEQYSAIDNPEFNMYYAFYSCMHIGQLLGLSFRVWWAIMSLLAMSVIVISCKIHKYNLNVFLATFMAYYEMVFYSGFKFFYGFCFLLLAYGFLIRNTIKGKILYTVFVCLASSFHPLYYIFLVFLIKPIKKPKCLIYLIVLFTIIITVIMRLSGSAMSLMAPIFNIIDNEHVNIYTEVNVRSGFYIALFIHLILVYIAYRILRIKMMLNKNYNTALSLFYTVLISIVFCPFYAVAMTFMRFITAFSLVVITASSSILTDSIFERKLCSNLSVLMVMSYWVIQLVVGSFIRLSVIPFFDVF